MSVLLVILQIINVDTCSWMSVEEALSMTRVVNQQQQHDSGVIILQMLIIDFVVNQQQQHDSLDVNTSWAIWKAAKAKRSNSYMYLLQEPTGITEIISFTQVEVKNGNVYSQKHIAIRPHVLKEEWICQPDIWKCPVQQRIDSLRTKYPNQDEEHDQRILNHIEIHLDRQIAYEVLECWERYGEESRIPVDEFSRPKAKTMDELYQDCASDAEGVHYDNGHKMMYAFRVNSEGYVSECGLWNPFMKDGVLEGFNIIKFEWNP